MAQTHRDLACGPPAGEDGQIREIFEYDETAWGGREELGHSGHGPQGGMSIGSEGSGGHTGGRDFRRVAGHDQGRPVRPGFLLRGDRKSTRQLQSPSVISYAVFCLKKKKKSPPISTRAPATALPATANPLTSDYTVRTQVLEPGEVADEDRQGRRHEGPGD